MPSHYAGRFAPSPNGPLHFGSLVTAAASYLDARASRGVWLVRMEDLDRQRCSSRWADHILRTLESYGFEWDGPVMYQSAAERQAAYLRSFSMLVESGVVYACGCSRKDIAGLAVDAGENEEPRYPGTCRNGTAPGQPVRAWRVVVNDEPIVFTDRRQGVVQQRLQSSTGDFALRRGDGSFVYQLAVVVDDAEQGITDIVRGADLQSSTPRQVYLQQLLGLSQPAYMHVPLVRNAHGQKLSKQTAARAIDRDNEAETLCSALEFLGHQPPAALKNASLREVWQWSIENWQSGAVHGCEARCESGATPCKA